MLTWEWRSSFPRNLLCFLTEIVRRYSGLMCCPCSRNLGLKQKKQCRKSLKIEYLRSFKPDRLLHKCVKTHKKRHLLFFISHWELFLFEAVNLVCRFHVMANSVAQTQICLRYLCHLQPSPGSRERRQYLNSSLHWLALCTFPQLPGRCKNE